MAFNYMSGHRTGVTFQAEGNPQAALLSVEGHTWDEEVLRHLTTSTTHNGIQARITGPIDGKGTIKACLNIDDPPYLDPPEIRAGVSGVLRMWFGIYNSNGLYVIPVLIGAVHYVSEVQAKVTWSFDVEMNANLSTVYTRPVA